MSVAGTHRFIASSATAIAAMFMLAVMVAGQGQRGERGAGAAGQGRGEGRGRGPAMKLSDPVITDPAIQNGGIDMHAHQDPDSNGPSYGQAARSDDALDLIRAGQGRRHARLRDQGAPRSERRAGLLHAQAPSRHGNLRRHGQQLHHRARRSTHGPSSTWPR